MRNNDSIQRLGFKVEAKPQKYLSVGVGWGAEGGGRGHDEAEVEEHRSVFANMMNDGASQQSLGIDNKWGGGGGVEVTECKGWDSGVEKRSSL